MRRTLSLDSPYTIEREPDELLPTIPAIVAWSTVEVSGPNSRPNGAAAALSDAWITPGSTRARRRSGSMAMILSSLKQSMMSPGPTACPARLVPAPRTVSGRPCPAATAAAEKRSSTEPATSTASGTTR